MRDVSQHNFGLLIAYILPGFVLLSGLSPLSPTLSAWLRSGDQIDQAITLGGFLYATLSSVALGMATGSVRWLIVDSLHSLTGFKRPAWDERRLQANLQAFDSLIEHHYRHYQFHSNTLVALAVVYAAHRVTGTLSETFGWTEVAGLMLALVFWLASRDNLRKYYDAATALLQENPVTNGRHPASVPSPPAEPRAAQTPATAKPPKPAAQPPKKTPPAKS